MNKLSITLCAIFTVTAIASAFVSAEQDGNGARQLLVYKDCQLIHQTPMTSDQMKAYSALQQEEDKMSRLELPIEAIQMQLEQQGEELKRLSELVFEDTTEKFVVNKAFLEKHEQAADRLNALIEAHKQDFTALERQGEEIGKKARIFEQNIESELTGLDYDHVRIVGASRPIPSPCNPRI